MKLRLMIALLLVLPAMGSPTTDPDPVALQQQAEAAVTETRKRQPAYALLAEQQAGFRVSWREQLRQFMAVNGRRNTQAASRAIATALGLNASTAYLSRSDDNAIDALLIHLFAYAIRSYAPLARGPVPPVTLVALGGYGRGELSPLSDVDVMFLFATKTKPGDANPLQEHLSNEILAGCTRRALMRLAKEEGVEIVERKFTVEEALAADEAFLTSASQFVMPIVEIDGHRIGGGQPGPVVRKLRELFLKEAGA